MNQTAHHWVHVYCVRKILSTQHSNFHHQTQTTNCWIQKVQELIITIHIGHQGVQVCCLYSYWASRCTGMLFTFLLGIKVYRYAVYILTGHQGVQVCCLYSHWESRCTGMAAYIVTGHQGQKKVCNKDFYVCRINMWWDTCSNMSHSCTVVLFVFVDGNNCLWYPLSLLTFLHWRDCSRNLLGFKFVKQCELLACQEMDHNPDTHWLELYPFLVYNFLKYLILCIILHWGYDFQFQLYL